MIEQMENTVIEYKQNRPPLPEVLGYRVLLDMTWRREGSKIELPDTATLKENEGIIVALGNGRHNYTETRYPFDVNAGDCVLVSSYGGVDFQYGEKTYRIVSAEDIVAVLQRAVPFRPNDGRPLE